MLYFVRNLPRFMKFTRISPIVLLFLQFFSFGQTEINEHSRILYSNANDTAIFQVEMRGTNYDARKNRLPYFLIGNTTHYDQTATPVLSVKKTLLVQEPHAAVIKKYFSKYLTNQFTLEKIQSLSKNENLNHFKLFPFRLNALNQLEELITYDLSWQTTAVNNSAARGASVFSGNSVLSSGNWYKIGVTQTGIHKLSKSFFNSIGINTTGLDITKIRVYGNGGKMIPERNRDFRNDDLVENAIKIVLAPDGSFDYALFYATGTTQWVRAKSNAGLRFQAIKSLYSDTSFYFINVDIGAGKRISPRTSLSQTPDLITSSYDYYNYHEEDITNFGKSGRNFYGEYFDLQSTYSIPPSPWNDGDFFNQRYSYGRSVTGSTL